MMLKLRIALRILLIFILFPVVLWASDPKPPEPGPLPVPPPSDFPIWGGVAGQFHKHAALTVTLNDRLNWQVTRWQVSSWVIDSIGWLEFRDSLLNCLTPPDVRILLQLRWNSLDLNPVSRIQHCVPKNWGKWWRFCYRMARLFKDDNVWFQLGNEPEADGHKFWSGTLPEFIFYVNYGAAAIKWANPDAYVVCGGFTGGRGVSRAIREIVEGLDTAKVGGLDRHVILTNLTEAELDDCIGVWPDYCHQQGFDCFFTEVSPPRFDLHVFDKAKKKGVECFMFFNLWGGKQVEFPAANQDGTATRAGKKFGRWIERNTQKSGG